MLGEIISIGGTILGMDEQESQNDAINAANQRNIELQKEFAQHGVTWRVEDAKRAGVHPLFALGGSGAAFSPTAIPVMNDGVGDAVRRVGSVVSDWERQQLLVDSAAASVEKDQAQADYYRALAAKARQGANTSNPVLPDEIVHQGTPNVSPPMEGYYDRRKVQANPVFSRDSNFPSVGAGSSPGFRAYEIFPGKVIDLPYSEEGPSESMENLTIVTWPFVIAHNIQHYGAEWLRDMWHIINPFVENADRRSKQ